ncbi:hypothetical protein BN961_00519 [Afipia felis]|uniref:Uncharacterized protein n=1 Tax=Afipia felis TaxID=1035 RepID=A0A090N6N0_AFIFE|nr:hypothetical protein BN961_00519 [Afipia felis]
MQRQQQRVQKPIMLEDIDPGIDADQERGPERHHHQHHRDALPALRQPRHRIGDRIANHEQDRGRDQRHGDAAQVGEDINVVGGEQIEIVEREFRQAVAKDAPPSEQIEGRRIRRLRDHGLRQRDLQHEAERHQEEQRHPDIGCDGGDPCRAGEDAAAFHCVSTTASSGANDTITCCPASNATSLPAALARAT